MSDIFYLRPVAPPVTPETVQTRSKELGDCLDLHRVVWTCSFLATEGGRMLCWFQAPDAESARLALRQLGSDMNAVWPGIVLGDHRPGDEAILQVNMLAEVSFDEPFAGGREEAVQRFDHQLFREAATTATGFLSTDRRRMICLFQATDAGAVRPALEAAALPPKAIWPCRVVTPHPALL